jgi:hypothetical protein
MVGTIFLIVVLIALANICSDLAMRIRLSKRLASENRLSWFMRSSDEVGRTYQDLFPGSFLSPIVRHVFWLLLATAAAMLISQLTSK